MLGLLARLFRSRASARRRELCERLDDIRTLVRECVPEDERTRALAEYERTIIRERR